MTAGVMKAGAAAGCLRLEGNEQDGSNGERGGSEFTEADSSGGGTESVEETANEIELVEAWQRDGIEASTTVAGTLIAAIDDSDGGGSAERLERLGDDGETEWQTETLPDGESFTLEMHGRVLLGERLVVVVAHNGNPHESDNAKLYAYDADSGNQRWAHETDADREEESVRGLTGAGSAVYYCATGSSGTGSEQDSSVRALDIETGEVLWAEEFDEGFRTGVAVYGDRLYTSATQEIHAFDIATGELVGEYEFPTGFGGFAPAEETLYIGQQELHAYDPETSELRWSKGADRFSSPDISYHDGTIYGGARTGWVFAHDAADGERLWEERVDGSATELSYTGSDLLWVLNDETTVTALRASTGEVLYDDDIENRNLTATGRTVLFGETAYEVEA